MLAIFIKDKNDASLLVFRDLLWGPKLRVESLYLTFHPVSSPYPVLFVFINI
jgi:hypothetical protein